MTKVNTIVTKRPFRIVKIERHTHNVKVFTLRPVKKESIHFLPGMFVTMSIEKDGAKHGPRSYSVSSSPLVSDSIELTIQKVGVFTTELFKLEEGAEVQVQGPFGHFTLKEPVGDHLVLIAGGTGIAPMMSILRYVQDSGKKKRITLLFSCRTQADIIHKDELLHRSNEFDDFSYIQTLTREPQDSNWQGHRGRFNEETLGLHLHEPEEAEFYICGPADFVKAIGEALDELEVPAANVRREQWG
jgi:ferredoxin-NADP reductase